MKIHFWGAAQQVTGSMHILETDSGSRILIDCGLDYEKKHDFYQNNVHFPFDVKQIDAVVITHAHIDHTGNLPNFVRQGYKGKIYCTKPTAEFMAFLLQDSLKIQAGESGSKKRKSRSGKRDVSLLYTQKNIHETLDQTVFVDFYNKIDIAENLTLEMRPAGHILGAATCTFEDTKSGKRIGFTGDLGNYDTPLVVNPIPFENVDAIVCESTYGGRLHIDKESPEDILMHHITETCLKFDGKLVIPAFSVGRTQAIIYTLQKMFQQGSIKQIQVFTDSPLAIKSTRIYEENKQMLNAETQQFNQKHGPLFVFKELQVLPHNHSTEMISKYSKASIIISAAGMAEGGRIQEHIQNNLQNPFATILIAGFCAPGTLGARLLNGQNSVLVHGKDRAVMCKIDKTDVFSAHPDKIGLTRFLNESVNDKTKKIFLVHGELEAMESFKHHFEFNEIIIPKKSESFEV